MPKSYKDILRYVGDQRSHSKKKDWMKNWTQSENMDSGTKVKILLLDYEREELIAEKCRAYPEIWRYQNICQLNQMNYP